MQFLCPLQLIMDELNNSFCLFFCTTVGVVFPTPQGLHRDQTPFPPLLDPHSSLSASRRAGLDTSPPLHPLVALIPPLPPHPQGYAERYCFEF